MDYEGGTTLKNTRNQPVYPRTKAEYVEGLDDLISGSVAKPEGAVENSVPITDNKGDVKWVELQAGNISVKVTSDVFTGNNLEDVLIQISKEIKSLENRLNNTPGVPSEPGTTTSGFIPVLLSELPETGEVGIVYRVRSDGSDNDKYTEYYYVPESNGQPAHFEQIGVSSMQWLGDSDTRSNEWL